MAITHATIETAVESLVAAIDAESYTTARALVVKIRAYLLAIPDYGTAEGHYVKRDRAEIMQLLKMVDDLAWGNTVTTTKASLRHV